MNPVITKYGPAIGRCMIALIFLLSGIGKIGSGFGIGGGFVGTAGYMASKGLPMAEWLLILTIIVEIGGAAMIILGWKARLGATALFLFMIPVTLVFHAFWAVPPDQQSLQQIMFLKNVSMMGAMLYIMAYGSGSCSADKR